MRNSFCVQYIGSLGGCRLRGCCKFYDSVCRAKGFCLLLAKDWESVAALTPLNRYIL